MWKIWLIISGVCLVIEAITVDFLTFWFALGALFAMVISFFVPNVVVQSVVFLISSTILILSTRKLVNKFIKKDAIPTNVYSFVGKHGIVILDIDSNSGTGQIKVNGETWSAKSDEGVHIPKDSEVEIVKIEGVKAYVKPI